MKYFIPYSFGILVLDKIVWTALEKLIRAQLWFPQVTLTCSDTKSSVKVHETCTYFYKAAQLENTRRDGKPLNTASVLFWENNRPSFPIS